MRGMFDEIAPVWDCGRSPDAFAPVEAALERVSQPKRALDLGTGTGTVALMVAQRFPKAEVVGADLSPGMLIEARRKTPPELADRVRFDEADAERLPYGDEWFDLVTLANMIPFFDELDRVVAPGGWVVFGWSVGSADADLRAAGGAEPRARGPRLHGFVGNCGGERHRVRCPQKGYQLDLPQRAFMARRHRPGRPFNVRA